MSRFVLPGLIVLALATAGCQKNSGNEQAFIESSSEVRPVIAVVPVIDSTTHDYTWNLSDELTSSLYTRLAQRETLYLAQLPKVRSVIKKLKETNNPFGTDFGWIKEAFQGEQFVAFFELIEHEEILKQDRKKDSDSAYCSADLSMSMRVRVFDVRGEFPKIVLQELVHDTHYIPRQFTHANFQQADWGDESFSFSPLGLAHAEFTKQVASRVEEYVLLASQLQ